MKKSTVSLYATIALSFKTIALSVTKTYTGDMTNVGESVAITGVMATSDTASGIEQEVGYFNMIDATDERLGEDKKV